MKTRILTNEEVIDLVSGTAVYASGGGGDHKIGLRLVKEVMDSGLKFEVAEPSEVPDDGIIVSIGLWWPGGDEALSHFDSDLPLRTLRSFEKFTGKKAVAITAKELGGLSTPVAMIAATKADLPIIDGDPSGRATPAGWLTLFTANNIPWTPMVLADGEFKIVVIFEEAPTTSQGGLAFSLMNNFNIKLGYNARQMVNGRELKEITIPHTLSNCIEVGKVAREAQRKESDVLQAVINASKGIELFRGRVDKLNPPEFVISGDGDYKGSSMRVVAPYEIIAAYKDGRPAALGPDIISVASPSGEIIPSERVTVGQEVVILGIRAPDNWRTKEGLDLWKMCLEGEGIKDIYTPLEKR